MVARKHRGPSSRLPPDKRAVLLPPCTHRVIFQPAEPRQLPVVTTADAAGLGLHTSKQQPVPPAQFPTTSTMQQQIDRGSSFQKPGSHGRGTVFAWVGHPRHMNLTVTGQGPSQRPTKAGRDDSKGKDVPDPPSLNPKDRDIMWSRRRPSMYRS